MIGKLVAWCLEPPKCRSFGSAEVRFAQDDRSVAGERTGCWLLAEGFLDTGFGERSHHRIACGGGMDAVVA
jgi:hypothetical protein